MLKPEVRIVEFQSETVTNPNISDWEKNQLLLKYGYTSNNLSNQSSNNFDPSRDLSYEELMRIEDEKFYQKQNYYNQQQTPKSYSIDPNRIQHSDIRVSGDDGFNFEVCVVSDMKIRGM